MKKNIKAGRLHFTTDYKSAYKDSEAIFIGVGTPELPDGSANLEYIATVSRQIAENIERNCLVVVKSTVPIGTNDKVEQFIKDFLVHNVKVEVASNPEFLAQGHAVRDTLEAKRIVIGTESKEAEKKLMKIYENFNLPIVSVSRRSAEMIKYASNDFLALKISYMNDIANLCFPKDTKAVKYLAKQNGYKLKTIEAAVDVNAEQKIRLFKKAKERMITFKDVKIAVLGLTFKAGTDDLREAPSLDNIKELLGVGANRIYAYDPVGVNNYKKIYPTEINYVESPEEALLDANICFVFTEWDEIRKVKPETFKKLMKTPIVYDGRNIYDLKKMKETGIEYYSIGR